MKLVKSALKAAYDVRLTWNNAWSQLDAMRRTGFVAKDKEVVETVVAPNLLEEAIPQKAAKILRGITGEFFLQAKGGERTFTCANLFEFVTRMREDRAESLQKPIPTILVNGQLVACRMYYYDDVKAYKVSFDLLDDAHASSSEELDFINRARQIHDPIVDRDYQPIASPAWDALSDLGLTATIGQARGNQKLALVKTPDGYKLKQIQKPLDGSVAITAI